MNLKTNDDPQLKQGYLYAVRLLTMTKRSEKELVKRLKEKGYPEETITQITERLKTQGILNDQKLLNETIHWSIQSKKYGRNRIFIELRKRGIAASEIEDALKNYSKEIERETASEVAEARWEKLKKIEPKKRKKRLYDFLISRGFDFELAREITTQLEANANN